jgi:hypothetical protein
VNLNVAVHDANVDELDGICTIAAHLGARSVSMKPVLRSGWPGVARGPLLSSAGLARFPVIREQLRTAHPRLLLAGEIFLAVRERLVDLLPIVADHVYHPAFGGSFSIKAVLPAAECERAARPVQSAA